MCSDKMNNLKKQVQWLIVRIITWLVYHFSINIKLLNVLLFPLTLFQIIRNYKKWNVYVRYKYIIGSNKSSVQFIINTFTRKTSDAILARVLNKYPGCFSKYVSVKGDVYVKELQRENKGVIVIGNHGGPFMLQTFVFSKVFNIPLSSYSSPSLKARTDRDQDREINQLIQQFPVYFVGEEKKFLNALLAGEWINILLDVTVNSNLSPNCTFAEHPIQLSQFPFRIALKYNIPVLYTEVKRVQKGTRIQIDIRPVNNFSDPDEGLHKYVEYLESTIFSDNYSNTLMPFVLQTAKTIA